NYPLTYTFAVQIVAATALPVEPKLVLVTLGDIASARNALSSAIDKIADPSVRLTPNRENNNFISVFLCCQRAMNLSSRLVNSKSHATRAGASDLFRAGRKFVIEARRKFDCCRGDCMPDLSGRGKLFPRILLAALRCSCFGSF